MDLLERLLATPIPETPEILLANDGLDGIRDAPEMRALRRSTASRRPGAERPDTAGLPHVLCRHSSVGRSVWLDPV